MPKHVASARKKGRAPRRDNMPLLIGGGVVAILLVAALIIINLTQSRPPAAPTMAAGRVWGKLEAPVTIDEYADFQCPICAQADRQMAQVASKYFDTGKAKLVFHNFAFIGQESIWAAEAASCAEDQGKFWDYANLVFASQAGENKGAFSKDNLKVFASKLGLDMTAFNSCLDRDKYASRIQQERDEATAKGLDSTPTFFINGQKLTGNVPADQWSKLIDSLSK